MAPSSSSLSMLFLMIMISSSSLPFFILVAGDEALIEKACKTTIYPDLCISTIKSDGSSSTADTKGLVGIVIKKAEGIAADATAFIAKNLSAYGQAGELCENHYVSAKQSLDESLKDLEANQFNSAGMKSSEARESTKTCVSDFGRFGVAYPVELKQREEVFEHLCDIASTIIAKLLV
ncbi:hypothetical protein FNV43_RR20486 [Rhamnella rubrinervis]|uniref:Pectinesterase inhibitor domain-containing protein n=1 Tax=Rhamnella rubrinervis TaxID=2594499 RepID=A0A8K0E1I4_9ROSA|nr:hypothetical protein FNV43_RR20486 [Rhamnella rubrinervis]